jgi:hypothetical protein
LLVLQLRYLLLLLRKLEVLQLTKMLLGLLLLLPDNLLLELILLLQLLNLLREWEVILGHKERRQLAGIAQLCCQKVTGCRSCRLGPTREAILRCTLQQALLDATAGSWVSCVGYVFPSRRRCRNVRRGEEKAKVLIVTFISSRCGLGYPRQRACRLRHAHGLPGCQVE